MKAVVSERYGEPDSVEIREVEKPQPSSKQIQVRVMAAALNDFDWGLISGKPYFIRLFLGWRKPKITISGCDIAGRVTAVGEDVTRWQVGDEVYGDLSGGRFGGFAEFVCCGEEEVAAKPRAWSYVEAAAVPQAAVLAWQGLRAGGGLQAGQRILINGAGGGVGSYGIQLAREFDIELTGVDSGDKLEFMRDLGFHRVLDYRQQDYTRTGERYDLIVDTKSYRSPFALLRALKPGGVYATVGGSMWRMAQYMLLGPFIKLVTGKSLKVLTLAPNEGLDYFSELANAGKLQSSIDGIWELEEFASVLQYYLRAEHRGKIVFKLE